MMKILREQQGTVIILVALAVTAIMAAGAIAVDLGNLYVNKTRLSNVADAAALAGAQDLPLYPDQAVVTARNYAAQNGKYGDIVEPSVQKDSYGNYTILKVTIKRNVPFFFARIFNMLSHDLTANATAKISPVSSATGVVPFGVVKQSFVFGQTYVLKLGGGSGYDGNFGALALGGSGATVYRNNIKNGYNGLINLGDWLPTETGNMSGPTLDGVNYRISLDPAASFETVQKGSPRIIVVPVIHDLSVNGSSDVQVVGFAAFFLEGTGGQGNDNFVYGKFMEMVIPSNIYKNEGYGSITDDIAVGYGLYGSTLIQ